MAQERLHVAVFPAAAGLGHLNPMLELSRRLVTLGFTVSFLVTKDAFAKMQNEGDHIRFLSIPNLEPGAPPFLMNPKTMLQPVEAALRASETPVKCIISDFFVGWTQDVANNMGIARFVFVTCGSAAEQLYYHLPLLISKGHVPVTNAHLEDNQMITCVPGAEHFHPRELPLACRINGPLLPVVENQMQRMKESICILVNTVEELEQQVVNTRRSEDKLKYYLPIGPLMSLKQNSSAAVNICMEWLDNQAPASVLYVAFGSDVSLPVDKVKLLVDALERTDRPFLWAMRKNFAANAAEGCFEGVVKTFQDSGQGVLVEWAPQTQVLEHGAVGAFLTHCGWNSVMETAASGVPALCWPCGAEQNMNAAILVDEWKMGLHVAEGSGEGVTVELISSLIEAAMDGDTSEELRKRARDVQKIIRASQEDDGSSCRNLQTLKVMMENLSNI